MPSTTAWSQRPAFVCKYRYTVNGAGDVVLIAGKVHERYQHIGAVRQSFSDAAVARRCLHAWPASLPTDDTSERAP